MINCAFCLEMIDDDSFYCDMCGEGVKNCLDCKKTGKGKNCTFCGKPLTLASLQQCAASLTNSSSNNISKVETATADTQQSVNSNATRHVASDEQVLSGTMLRLINNNIEIDVELKDGDIIGRTTGRHINIFSNFKQVSGRHCQFSYDKSTGWSVTDLGSTFKTACNDQQLIANQPYSLSDQALLKIASSGEISPETGKPLQSIEFLIRIIPT